jgi:hypothetical protein
MAGLDLERSERMGQRVARTAAKLGFSPEECGDVAWVHARAMTPRHAVCTDDHDPRWLHPGRSALILLLDVGRVEPAALALAMVRDSAAPELSVDPRQPDFGPGPSNELVARLTELYGEWVEPADESEVERLLAASTPTRLAALAEQLDHLRHAHLWPDLQARRAAHERARSFYLPLAERTHEKLARRFAWWVGMFGQRHLD